jgi:hypothetical protein
MTDSSIDPLDIVDEEIPEIEDFASLIAAADALPAGDADAANRLMTRAARASLSDGEADLLVRAIAKALRGGTSGGIKVTRAAWAVALKAEADRRWTEGAQERARQAAEEEARRRREQEEEQARLARSCAELAEDPQLLARVEKVAQQLGLVGEGAGARGVFLAATSRLLAETALRLVRLGAPASGKNVVVERVLELISTAAVVQISGVSPKALAYYGGDDPDALKGKILYFPEASLLADRRGGEESNEFATMLRTLISEGRLSHQTVRIVKNRPPVTETIVKNGPIAVVLTTAKDIDLELKTRTLVQESDESGLQTVRIAKRILSEPRPRPDLEPWLALQIWLELDAPYRVHVPFRKAIFMAFEAWRKGFLEKSTMRMRRDIASLVTAVEASAVLHKAQREIRDDGVIVATLEDYRHAHEAFDAGLSAVYGAADEKVIATVEAVEAMLRESGKPSVKVTIRVLAKRLRVASTLTAKERLDAAVDFGALEQDDEATRGKVRFFSVKKSSADIKKAPRLGVFPPVEQVATVLKYAPAGQGASMNGRESEPMDTPADEPMAEPMDEPSAPDAGAEQPDEPGAEEWI